jgi:RHS repeat-associated protein
MGNWTYQYDVLNRLTSGAASTGTYASQNACWSYDDFGNRTIESVQTGACSTAGTFASTMVFNAANQLSGVIPPGGGSQSPSSLLYDAAGDVTSDSSTGNQYVYDAEGRICAFQTPSGLGGTIMMGYLYDADGIRVAKGTITTMTCDPATNGFAMTGNNTGTYVLGQGGEELTQLSGSGAWQRTNVFGGGKQLATYDSMGLHFQIEDALGTRRMQTNADGQPETDIQSLPYGDKLATATDQYAPATADDATPLHFTGKERDTESGNDYFGARYYGSSMGRFLIPDWSAIVEPVPYAKLDDPQSLNLYAYVHNNPLSGADPDGHIDCSGSNAQSIGCQYNANWLAQHGEDPTQDPQVAEGQQQDDSGWTSEKPTSGEYVSVSDWPKSAAGFHHVGIAVDSDNTQGFSTADSSVPWWERLFGAPQGNMENDIQHHTNLETLEVAPHTYMYHSITHEQAGLIQAAIATRQANDMMKNFAGRYNLLFNNCAQAVESFLHAGGVSGIPHGEVNIPIALHGVMLLERGSH